MRSEDAAARRAQPAVYLLLLAIQTAGAVMLFQIMFPLFRQIVTQVGTPQQLHASTVAAAAATALAMQVCYWIRYRHVPVAVPIRGALAAHLVLFASRVSFFFAGATFSAIFFRHVPQLDMLPPLGQGLAKALGVMVLLFASFCYAMELERLGRAIEEDANRTR